MRRGSATRPGYATKQLWGRTQLVFGGIGRKGAHGALPGWMYLIVKKSNCHANRLRLELELSCIYRSHLQVPLSGEH